jgi:hypothetical protein
LGQNLLTAPHRWALEGSAAAVTLHRRNSTTAARRSTGALPLGRAGNAVRGPGLSAPKRLVVRARLYALPAVDRVHRGDRRDCGGPVPELLGTLEEALKVAADAMVLAALLRQPELQ